jgi:hypothetical protein
VLIADKSPADSVRDGTYTLTVGDKCATAIPCKNLIGDADIPFEVKSFIVFPGGEFGLTADICVFEGITADGNPLVVADTAIGFPSVDIAKQLMLDDMRENPQLKPVKGVGNQALHGCASRTSCEIVITVARFKGVVVDADTNTSSVNTIALVKKMIARLPK